MLQIHVDNPQLFYHIKYWIKKIMAEIYILRVNSDKVQNVGQGQNLDNLRTPLI